MSTEPHGLGGTNARFGERVTFWKYIRKHFHKRGRKTVLAADNVGDIAAEMPDIPRIAFQQVLEHPQYKMLLKEMSDKSMKNITEIVEAYLHIFWHFIPKKVQQDYVSAIKTAHVKQQSSDFMTVYDDSRVKKVLRAMDYDVHWFEQSETLAHEIDLQPSSRNDTLIFMVLTDPTPRAALINRASRPLPTKKFLLRSQLISKPCRMKAVASTVTLATGQAMPVVGLGTWKSVEEGAVEAAVVTALATGYRHIDCAHVYGNEADVGKALSTTCVPREDIFITSKLWNSFHEPERVKSACQKSLSALRIDYLDLYLIHWPIGFKYVDGNLFPMNANGTMQYGCVSLLETWSAMEALVKEGLVKAIGLSNFNQEQVSRILASCSIKPAILQVENHPYLNQAELVQFCNDHEIVVTAYSPLGSPDRPWARPEDPSLLQHPVVNEIAAELGKTAGHVLIRFQVERGIVVIPKSVSPKRIAANLQVFDFQLSDDQMHRLLALNINFRYCVPTVKFEGNDVPRDAGHPEYPF